MKRKKILYVAGLQAGGIATHLETLVKYFSQHNEVILAVPGNTELQRFSYKMGFPCRVINLSGRLNPAGDLQASAQLFRICREEKVDLLHIHGFKAAMVALPISGLCRLPVVFTVHNFPAYPRASHLPLKCFNWSLRTLDCLVNQYITVSNALGNMLVDLGVRTAKISTVYNGIDTRRYPVKLTRSSGQEADHVNIGTVGRLVSHKGMDMFIRAAAGVSGKFPNARFYVVGDGPERENLERLSRQGGHLNIEIMGSINEMPRYLSSLDIFVLFSRSEGLSISLLEAGSTGLPLVGAETGGIPEVIRHQKTGLLVEPENVPALESALVRLIDNSAERERMGAEAARDIRRRFDVETMLQKTETVYQQVLDERPGLLWAQ